MPGILKNEIKQYKLLIDHDYWDGSKIINLKDEIINGYPRPEMAGAGGVDLMLKYHNEPITYPEIFYIKTLNFWVNQVQEIIDVPIINNNKIENVSLPHISLSELTGRNISEIRFK